jgi:ABC-type transporter Mla subunit MlaD
MSRMALSRNQLIGVSVTVIGTLVYIFAFLGGFGGVLGASTQTVKANFDSVEYIVANDPVRIDGVQVGTVEGTSVAPGGKAGTVTMSVQSKYHIYNDASANLVWRTILGGNDAIAIDPGTRDAGPLHGAIPVSRDSNQVELDQVILPFHDGAQSGLQTLLNQLGPALSDHVDLANDLNVYRGVAHAADVGGGALRGEVQDTDLRNLVKNAGQAAQALSVGTNASTTQQFVESAANTLEDLGGNPANLKASIEAFTSVYVDGSNYVFEPYNHLLSKVDSLVGKLDGSVPKIVPALDQFNPTLANAHTLLRDATPLVHKLAPAVDSLATTAKTGVPVVNQLSPGLTALAKTTLPGLAAKYPEEGGKTVYQLIGPTLVGLGVLTDFYNQDGEFANLTAGLEGANDQQVLPCTLDFSQSASPTDLLACQSLSGSLSSLLSGGTSLLQSLARKPGGEAIYGKLLKSAERNQAQENVVEQTLEKVAPSVAKFIFHSNGAVK